MELRARLRARVVEELCRTETIYLADLRTVLTLFLVPLRDKIPSADHAKVFSNLEMIVGLHEQMLPFLQAQEHLPPESQTIGGILLKFVCFSSYLSFQI